jgi:hypothetical protein
VVAGLLWSLWGPVGVLVARGILSVVTEIVTIRASHSLDGAGAEAAAADDRPRVAAAPATAPARPPRAAGARRTPRAGTTQAAVLARLPGPRAPPARRSARRRTRRRTPADHPHRGGTGQARGLLGRPRGAATWRPAIAGGEGHGRFAVSGPRDGVGLRLVGLGCCRAGPGRAARAAAQGGRRVAEGLLARQRDGAFAPVTFDPADAPLGLRSNNWVGLKGPNLDGRWPGQTGANAQGFARFDDPAQAIRAFVELVRDFQRRRGARSAADVLARYSPPGDCSGAPSVPPGERREGGGCPENQTTPPASAARAARAVGLRPTDDLELFGPDGRVAHPDRLRALIDAVVAQELGPAYCPQPPRGENWIGCRVDDALYARAVESPGPGG